MSKPDIAAFVAARLDEAQSAAKAATSVAGPDWKSGTFYPGDGSRARACLYSKSGAFLADLHGTPDYPDLSAHIAAHDPARVLREVAALRAIVQWCIPDASVETALENGDVSVEDYVAHKTIGAHVLRHAAAIWQDHPDYDERWKP